VCEVVLIIACPGATHGLVPTTLAEPTDSIILPESEDLELFVNISSSEFDIEDEFSKEHFDERKVMNICDVESNKMAKRISKSSKTSNKDDAEASSTNTRKRQNSSTSKSRDGSRGGGKRARSIGTGDSVGVQGKQDCYKCKESFDPSEFRRHVKLDHNVQCDQENCDYLLETNLDLINHKKKVHLIEPTNSYSSNWQQECEACGKAISGKRMKEHLNTPHSFPCQVDPAACQMRFLTKDDHTRHMKKVHNAVVSKVQCQTPPVQVIAVVPKIKKDARQKPAARKRRISRPDPSTTTPDHTTTAPDLSTISPDHTKTPNMKPLALRAGSPMPDENYWLCNLCDEAIPTFELFTSHTKKPHKFPCEQAECSTKLLTMSDMLRHLWTGHGVTKQMKECSQCKEPVDSKSFQQHYKRMHHSQCGYEGCGAMFVQNRNLWQHMIKKHGYGRRMKTEEETSEDIPEEIPQIEVVEDANINLDELDVAEIENDVLREEGAGSNASVAIIEEIEQVVEADEGGLIRCKVCGLYYSRDNIVSHSKKFHRWKCVKEDCPLVFTKDDLMYQHCYTEHDDKILAKEKGYFVCPECFEFFAPGLINSYENHVKKGVHLTCDKCEKKFAKCNNDLYKFHCEFAHKAETDAACGECDMAFVITDAKLAESHRKKPHVYGPCQHCSELSNKYLMFATKERFSKHHEISHSSSVRDCSCIEDINKDDDDLLKAEFDVKGEDAYDLTEQVTDDSSFDDEEVQFNFKNDQVDDGNSSVNDVANLFATKYEDSTAAELEDNKYVVKLLEEESNKSSPETIKFTEAKKENETLPVEIGDDKNVDSEMEKSEDESNKSILSIEINVKNLNDLEKKLKVDVDENLEEPAPVFKETLQVGKVSGEDDAVMREVCLVEPESEDTEKSNENCEINVSKEELVCFEFEDSIKGEYKTTGVEFEEQKDVEIETEHPESVESKLLEENKSSESKRIDDLTNAEESGADVSQEVEDNLEEILEVSDMMNESSDIDACSNQESNGPFKEDNYLMEIQDNSISTTENIDADSCEVPVEELLDSDNSDPEVSSSFVEGDSCIEEDRKDIGISPVDMECDKNLIGNEGEIRLAEEVERSSIAVIDLAVPEVKEDTSVNLVPYVDTDSDCDSLEEHEKRMAATEKLSSKSRNGRDGAGEVKPVVLKKGKELKKGQVLITRTKGEVSIIRNDVADVADIAEPKAPKKVGLLKKVMVRNLVSDAKQTPKAVKRAASSDAQIVYFDESKVEVGKVEINEDKHINVEIDEDINVEIDEDETVNKIDDEKDGKNEELVILETRKSSDSEHSSGFGNFLDNEVSPSTEEMQRALKRVRRQSGERSVNENPEAKVKVESSVPKFSLLGKLGRSPPKILGPPRPSIHEELINFSNQTQKIEDEYSFCVDGARSDQDVGSYQYLHRPGKPGRKKPCKSSFSHETEETQMQADMARLQQEKRNQRMRQNMLGKIGQAGPSHPQPGPSVPRTVCPTSVIRAVPKLPAPLSPQPGHISHFTAPVVLSAQPVLGLSPLSPQPSPHLSRYVGQPALNPAQQAMLNNTMVRHTMPPVPVLFGSVATSLSQQCSIRPPTMQTVQSVDAELAMPGYAPTELAMPGYAEPELLVTRDRDQAHRTYSSARRSKDATEQSYDMDMDSEDFDLSVKLEELEKDIDRSEANDDATPEESLENIKNLLDSQVASLGSSSSPTKDKPVLSDGEDLGLFSPGDQEPEESYREVLQVDEASLNASVISIASDISIEDVPHQISSLTDMKTIENNQVIASPIGKSKSQDEGYDDVDDLLGDSDEDDDEPMLKKEPIAQPIALPAKVPVPSEPSRKKPPKFVCPECGEIYGKNESQYNSHIRQQHNFPCKYCPLKFTYVNGLEEHHNSVHIHETAQANSESFCCNICNKSFKRKGPYLKHKKRDHNIPCIECGMSFTNEPFLEEHMASMHGINSPPRGSKALEMRKPTSPVEVKFQLANGLINDSPPKKSKPLNDGGKKDHVVKKAVKMDVWKDSSKKVKNSKSISKKIQEISVLSDDDTICAKCGQNFEELEAFEQHIELPHEHQCGMKDCELSFVFQYYLDLHIYEEHKTGIKPDERDKPIEESIQVAANSFNDSSMEDQISLADLAVSEDYLPGIGPQSVMGGVDESKMKSLKNYRIPKKSTSPVKEELGLNESRSSSNSSWTSGDSPGKGAAGYKTHDSLRGFQSNKVFGDKNIFDQSVSSHFKHGKNVLGSSAGSSSSNFKCHECNIPFQDKHTLDYHVSSHYRPSTSRQPISNQEQKKLKCPLCPQSFEIMEVMMEHLNSKHYSGRIEKKHDYWCGLCRKGFETEKKFEDHEKIDHKYRCQFCHKAYILEVDLNHHVEKHHTHKSHKVLNKHRKGFTCQLCGVNISEIEKFKIHQSQGHNFSCYHDGCIMRFQQKKELETHLKMKHNIVQIRIGDDSEEEHRGYLTTERSQANIDIAEWAESWIDSPLAIDHMVKVMKGVVKSRRHDLFLDKREREQCSGSETSRLYQLSNPGFLGGGGEKDTVVITHLRDMVFMEYFNQADPKLVELGIGSAFLYANCVLFPETFIHQHQVQGKSREEAEQAFMEVAVDIEERKALNQEIKEAAVENRRETEEDSGDEWVDHSDMEEDSYE